MRMTTLVLALFALAVLIALGFPACEDGIPTILR